MLHHQQLWECREYLHSSIHSPTKILGNIRRGSSHNIHKVHSIRRDSSTRKGHSNLRNISHNIPSNSIRNKANRVSPVMVHHNRPILMGKIRSIHRILLNKVAHMSQLRGPLHTTSVKLPVNSLQRTSFLDEVRCFLR